MPTSTQPNRLFVHSSTSYGLTSNDTKMMVQPALPTGLVLRTRSNVGELTKDRRGCEGRYLRSKKREREVIEHGS